MTLDFGKLPFEKAFYVLAKTLPGFALMNAFEVLHPGTILWFFSIGFLGYATKVAFFLAVCFLVGYSFVAMIITVTSALAGAFGGAWGYLTSDRDPHQDDIAPWRDSEWRAAYTARYGTAAPADLKLVPKGIVQGILGEANAVDLGGIDQQQTAQRMHDVYKTLTEATDSIMNDKTWRMHYRRLHHQVLFDRRKEAIEEIVEGLDSNLAIAAFIIVSASIFLRPLRAWWLLVPSIGWLAVSAMNTSAKIYRLVDPWTTLREQIDSLTASK
jgi:hypothetical protein